MYVCARRPVYVPIHPRVHVSYTLCAYTWYDYMCMCVGCALARTCVYMCVSRGERRRWAILISLRGLSSTSTFPHRSRLCEASPASHPPPTRPRERTLRVVTFGGHFKPPSSTHPLLIPHSSLTSVHASFSSWVHTLRPLRGPISDA